MRRILSALAIFAALGCAAFPSPLVHGNQYLSLPACSNLIRGKIIFGISDEYAAIFTNKFRFTVTVHATGDTVVEDTSGFSKWEYVYDDEHPGGRWVEKTMEGIPSSFIFIGSSYDPSGEESVPTIVNMLTCRGIFTADGMQDNCGNGSDVIAIYSSGGPVPDWPSTEGGQFPPISRDFTIALHLTNEVRIISNDLTNPPTLNMASLDITASSSYPSNLTSDITYDLIFETAMKIIPYGSAAKADYRILRGEDQAFLGEAIQRRMDQFMKLGVVRDNGGNYHPAPYAYKSINRLTCSDASMFALDNLFNRDLPPLCSLTNFCEDVPYSLEFADPSIRGVWNKKKSSWQGKGIIAKRNVNLTPDEILAAAGTEIALDPYVVGHKPFPAVKDVLNYYENLARTYYVVAPGLVAVTDNENHDTVMVEKRVEEGSYWAGGYDLDTGRIWGTDWPSSSTYSTHTNAVAPYTRYPFVVDLSEEHGDRIYVNAVINEEKVFGVRIQVIGGSAVVTYPTDTQQYRRYKIDTYLPEDDIEIYAPYGLTEFGLDDIYLIFAYKYRSWCYEDDEPTDDRYESGWGCMTVKDYLTMNDGESGPFTETMYTNNAGDKVWQKFGTPFRMKKIKVDFNRLMYDFFNSNEFYGTERTPAGDTLLYPFNRDDCTALDFNYKTGAENINAPVYDHRDMPMECDVSITRGFSIAPLYLVPVFAVGKRTDTLSMQMAREQTDGEDPEEEQEETPQ